jgi:hypothetical protein
MPFKPKPRAVPVVKAPSKAPSSIVAKTPEAPSIAVDKATSDASSDIYSSEEDDNEDLGAIEDRQYERDEDTETNTYIP